MTGHSPSELYQDLTSRYGDPAYARIDTAASRAQKEALARLSPEQVAATELAGEPITAALTTAPGNGAPIGGLKVVAGVRLVRRPPVRHRGRLQAVRRILPRPRAPRRHPGPGPRDHRRRDRRLLTGPDSSQLCAVPHRTRSPHELHMVFTRVPPPLAGLVSWILPGGRGSWCGAPGRGRHADLHRIPPGRRPGRTVTLPDELAAVPAMRTFRPGVSPRSLPARGRGRAGQHPSVGVGVGGKEHGPSQYRGTARQLTTSRGGPGCSASARESHQLLAAQERGPARPGNRNDVTS